MNTEQIYTLVNGVNSQAFGQSALTVVDTQGLIALGNVVLSSSTNTEAFLNTLLQRIGRTIMDYRRYRNRLSDMVLDDFGQWIIKEPKTPSSNRTVLLPHHVAERIRKRGHITDLHPNIITKRFISKQESLGIEQPYRFHALRHFFASYLHAQNIPDAYVLRTGGWSTPHVMQKVYRHALDDMHLEYEQKAVSAFQIPFQDKYTQT